MFYEGHRSSHTQLSLKLISAILLSGGCPLAYAQTAGGADDGDATAKAGGDIIVTATRKSELLSKTPASITAISSQVIEDLDIKGLADYARLVPNLAWGHGTGGVVSSAGSTTVVIRGVTGSDTTNFYIDDTPLPQSLDPRIYFLDRIEVLRGPQGTLFGSSSMGGTIRLITSPPSGSDLNGGVTGQLFSVHHGGAAGVEVKGGVNIPVVDGQVAAQVSGIYNYTPGYFERTYDDPDALNLTESPISGPPTYVDNVGAVRTKSASFALRITPEMAPNLTLTPMVMYGKRSANGQLLADYDPNNLVQRRIEDVAEGYTDRSTFAALSASYKTGAGRIVSSTAWFKRKFLNFEDGTDGVTNAWRSRYVDYPYAIFPVQGKVGAREEQFNQELRFESDIAGPIQFIAGLFYEDFSRDYRNDIQAPGLAAATGGVYSDNNYTSERHINTKNSAVFGNVTLTPIDNLELSAGLRYSYQKYDEAATASGNYGFPGVRTFHTKAKPLTSRFSIKYELSPSTMIYSTVAQGFRMGGANNTLGDACAGLGLPYPTDRPIEYKSDKLWSYEVGVKTSIQNRLLLSATAFQIDWSDRQQAIAIRQDLCYARVRVNTGSAVSKGIELEASVNLTSEFSIRASLGYVDAHVIDPGANENIFKGQNLDGVPEWTGSINGEYKKPLDWGAFFLRAGYSYTGSSVSYTQTSTGLERDSYHLADVRTGVEIGDFTVSLFATNIFDERPNLSEVNPGASIVPPRYRYFVGQPRTVGIELGCDF